MSGAKAVSTWAALNDRQRLYLSTIFEADQAAEASMRAASARRETIPPASEWRQITYDLKLPAEFDREYSTIQNTLRRAGAHDSGSGATLAALKKRGLVQITHDHVHVFPIGMVPRVRVRLSTAGRAAARAGTGTTAPARTPRGLLSRFSLSALARLYVAGQHGLANDVAAIDPTDRAPSWNTLLRLRNRSDGALIEEFTLPAGNPARYRVRLSDRGRRHYELHHACYRETYPDQELPEPDAKPQQAHSGLGEHNAHRPRHLVRDTDLPLLSRLIQLETTGTCHLRRVLTEEHERIGEPVPAEVAALPAGLLRRQVRELTRTEKSIDRLAEHPDGPLVQLLDAPNGPFDRETHPTVPLVVLTPAGREHYARHLDEYRRAYPDQQLPPT